MEKNITPAGELNMALENVVTFPSAEDTVLTTSALQLTEPEIPNYQNKHTNYSRIIIVQN
tara:strand:+ start:2397 stop:2576 length:180 start_codon:yes stop_codon:yes gene_type:complete